MTETIAQVPALERFGDRGRLRRDRGEIRVETRPRAFRLRSFVDIQRRIPRNTRVHHSVAGGAGPGQVTLRDRKRLNCGIGVRNPRRAVRPGHDERIS